MEKGGDHTESKAFEKSMVAKTVRPGFDFLLGGCWELSQNLIQSRSAKAKAGLTRRKQIRGLKKIGETDGEVGSW